MTSETQCCDNVVTTLSNVATKIQPKPNVATTSCASWVTLRIFSVTVTKLAVSCGLSPATLLKKSLAQSFFCEFCEISNNAFFLNNSGRLLMFRQAYNHYKKAFEAAR